MVQQQAVSLPYLPVVQASLWRPRIVICLRCAHLPGLTLLATSQLKVVYHALAEQSSAPCSLQLAGCCVPCLAPYPPADGGFECRGQGKEPGRAPGKAKQPKPAVKAQAEASSGSAAAAQPGSKRFQPAVKAGSGRWVI